MSLPSERDIKLYVGSWGEWMRSVGVSWDDIRELEEGWEEERKSLSLLMELFENFCKSYRDCDSCPNHDLCIILSDLHWVWNDLNIDNLEEEE